MIVIGAGMAGLLAAAMLRNECTQVVERNSSIPNNHSAVLRFRSRAVSDVLNIPFKKVDVLKAVHPWKNPVADALAYSHKTNGTSMLRSIVSATGDLDTRYIAPPDLIDQMSKRVTAQCLFGHAIEGDELIYSTTPTISTMPMPLLMKLLGWNPPPDFGYVNGMNIRCELEDVDAYCSLYVPDPDFPGARISITGSEMIVECPGDTDLVLGEGEEQVIAKQAAELMGIGHKRVGKAEATHQRYSKIVPIDDGHRKRFIIWASEKHNIYSLGRFATWRPGLLLDDVVEDVRIIHGLINGATAYEAKKGL